MKSPGNRDQTATKSYQTATESYQTATESYQTATKSYQTATKSYQTATESYQTATESYQTATESYQTATESYQTATKSHHAAVFSTCVVEDDFHIDLAVEGNVGVVHHEVKPVPRSSLVDPSANHSHSPSFIPASPLLLQQLQLRLRCLHVQPEDLEVSDLLRSEGIDALQPRSRPSLLLSLCT